METFEIRIEKLSFTLEQISFLKECVIDFNPEKIQNFNLLYEEDYHKIEPYIVELACTLNKVDILSFFVDKMEFELKDQFFITACLNNALEVVQYFLTKNIDVFMLNNYPMFIVCKYGYLDLLKLFLQHTGVDPTFNDNEMLIVAGQYGQIQMVNYLISLGCDPYARNNFIIKMACEFNNLPMIQSYANANLSITNDLIYCLNICISLDHSEILSFYLQNEYFCPTMTNYTCFFTCLETDNVNILNQFFEHCYTMRIEIPRDVIEDFLSESDAIKQDSLCSLFLREKLGLGFACEFPLDIPLTVECHVCLEDSNLILPCRHTICSRCLIFLYKTKTCGVCRLPFDKSYIKRK